MDGSEPKPLKFDRVILNEKRIPLKTNDAADASEVTLRDLAEQALLINEQGLADDEKIKRYRLFNRIEGGTTFEDLETQDRALIQKCIRKAYGTLVMGRADDIIDAKD